MRHDRGERGECWDEEADGGRHHHECRSPWLEPDAVMESVGQTRIGHHDRPLRRVPQDRASIRIEMIVALTCVVMLVVRLRLFFGRARVAALAVSMCWNQKGNGNGGKQNARRTHGSSPTPGDSIGMNPCPG